jgi:multidrug efflux pump subunit AcrB
MSAAFRFLTHHKWVGVFGLLLISVAAFVLVKKTPTGFIPEEDQGFVIAVTQTPGGSSLSRTVNATDQISKIVLQDGAASDVWNVNGLNFVTFAFASPNAAVFSRVKTNRRKRTGTTPEPNCRQVNLAKQARYMTRLPYLLTSQQYKVLETVSGVEVTLQDRDKRSIGQISRYSLGLCGRFISPKRSSLRLHDF